MASLKTTMEDWMSFQVQSEPLYMYTSIIWVANRNQQPRQVYSIDKQV